MIIIIRYDSSKRYDDVYINNVKKLNVKETKINLVRRYFKIFIDNDIII